MNKLDAWCFDRKWHWIDQRSSSEIIRLSGTAFSVPPPAASPFWSFHPWNNPWPCQWIAGWSEKRQRENSSIHCQLTKSSCMLCPRLIWFSASEQMVVCKNWIVKSMTLLNWSIRSKRALIMTTSRDRERMVHWNPDKTKEAVIWHLWKRHWIIINS